MLVLIVGVCVCGALPAAAGAYATIAPPPHPSNSTGLPDGRLYEQVTPANKHGFPGGANGGGSGSSVLQYSIASPNGEALAWGSTSGAAAEVNSSGDGVEYVSERSPGGWKSRAVMPRGLNNIKNGGIGQQVTWLDFSSNLSHLVFGINRPDVAGAPNGSNANLYLEGSDPLAEPVWLARPVGEGVTLSENSQLGRYFSLLGASPDLSTVYFDFKEQLISRIPLEQNSWGLYEYHNGELSYAGVLPDGSIHGAMGIAMADGFVGYYSPAATGNQVSQDGSKVFFVSGAGETLEKGELYVHETEPDGTQKTVLVSQSQLPGHTGEQAPSGVSELAATPPGPRYHEPNAHPFPGSENTFSPLLGYASPDGSHVFFKSADRLTSDAPEGGGTYDFDVDTGVLEYVAAPGLAGIVTVAGDGSSLVFENNAVSPVELDRWSAGPHGGTVTPIVQLPGEDLCDGVSCVGPARLVDNNSVLVFSAEAPIAGFNDTGEFMQIFRYDFATNELGCVSCPSAGIVPSGSAELSSIDEEWNNTKGFPTGGRVVGDDRGVSADGSRVFFDSPDPLVPRDSDGTRDVYGWENGTLFLISSGTSSNNSLFLDSSESGGDVFFTTTDGLAPGDNDEAFDVYDARIPRPGDNPPPVATPCQGDVCQGAPSVPSLLSAPSSATFVGLGNPAPQSGGGSAPSPKPRAKVPRCRRGFVEHKGKCVKTHAKKSSKRAKSGRK